MENITLRRVLTALYNRLPVSLTYRLSGYFVLDDPMRLIKKRQVNLLYWIPTVNNNVGDYLSKVVFDYTKQYFGISSNKSESTKKLACIGSIINFISGGESVVWGAGLKNEKVDMLTDRRRKVSLDVRAVRGPKTREELVKAGFDCPEVYGDPALLLPLFYKPEVQRQEGKITLIPHYTKLEDYKYSPFNILSTVTNDWKHFIDEIYSSECIISSSLHGLILGEAYGVPSVMLWDEADSKFKYEDYYASTNRNISYITDPNNYSKFKNNKLDESTIHNIQRNLLHSFPRELFKD